MDVFEYTPTLSDNDKYTQSQNRECGPAVTHVQAEAAFHKGYRRQ